MKSIKLFLLIYLLICVNPLLFSGEAGKYKVLSGSFYEFKNYIMVVAVDKSDTNFVMVLVPTNEKTDSNCSLKCREVKRNKWYNLSSLESIADLTKLSVNSPIRGNPYETPNGIIYKKKKIPLFLREDDHYSKIYKPVFFSKNLFYKNGTVYYRKIYK